MSYHIDEMTAKDWEDVARIYMEGISTGIATFQPELPTWEEWDGGHVKACRLVVREAGRVLGWAALSLVSKRAVYAGVADVSIYIGKDFRGRGVGEALLTRMIEDSEKQGFWSLQSGIIRENTGSRRLHQKCGFREIGYKERVGRMPTGKWHDVVMMERRSRICGQD